MRRRLLFPLLAVAVATPLVVQSVRADQEAAPAAYQDASTKNGALLYDNWPKLKGVKPADNHALYPATAKKSGAATWRCKECHGWDYKGAAGRYASGSHFTGIAGVEAAITKSPGEVYGTLTNGEGGHDFAAHLSEAELWDLVRFLREGQRDIARALDTEARAKGSAEAGRPLYEQHCLSCHGADGNAIDFKQDKEGIQGVGWYALDNPWESLHKYRWGDAGSDMPSMVADAGLSEQQIVDILAYGQELATP